MSLKGKLLVAMPILRDPNFERTVVYVLEHGEAGALGVVLNRPHPMSARELMPRWAEVCDGSLFVGGPVAHDAAICVARATGAPPAGSTYPVVEDIVTIDLDGDPAMVAPVIAEARIFIGYAGWDAAQLESELGEDAWLICDAMAGDVFTPEPDALWSGVLKRQKGKAAFLATFPPDPRAN